MFSILFVLANLAVFSHGFLPKPQPGGRIVGGVEVDIEDIPFQVSLQKWGVHRCGGSLISDEWVLTAGHCFGSGYSISVRLGSTYHNKGGTVINLGQLIPHPRYNSSNSDFDFALIKLASPIPESAVWGVVKLPEQDEDVRAGEIMRTSGWGKTQNPTESSEHLRAVDVPKVNQGACYKTYHGGVTPRMICAGFTEGGKDACQGDAGGPLTFNGKLVGVVSWGYECAVPGYPGVYGRVASVRDWIRKTSGV